MRKQGGGAIVQMSSVGGQVTAPGFSAYCATKFALEGFTETLQAEVAPFGLRTLIVEPGAFRTGLFRRGAVAAPPRSIKRPRPPDGTQPVGAGAASPMIRSMCYTLAYHARGLPSGILSTTRVASTRSTG